MKIRSDFVTNSSSGSFIRLCIFDDEFYDFIERLWKEKKYVDCIRDYYLNNGSACTYLELTDFNCRGERHRMVQVDSPDAFSSNADLIESFFDLNEHDSEMLDDQLDRVLKINGPYLTDHYIDYTDGYTGKSKLNGPTADLFRRLYGTEENKFITSRDKKTGKNSLDYYNGLDEKVEIPSDMNRIGPEAFTNSEEMISLYIPKGVTEIDEDTFIGCINLKHIFVDPENPVYSSGKDNDHILVKETGKLVLTTDPGLIPENVRIIGKNAFTNLLTYKNLQSYKIRELSIPEYILEIEPEAFREANGLNLTLESTSVKLGEKLFKKNWNGKRYLYFRSGSLKKVPAEYKRFALYGFLNHISSFDKESEDYGSYIKYIDKNQKSLYDEVKEYEVLVSIFIENKILPLENVDILIKKIGTAKKRAHLVQALNRYKNGEDVASIIDSLPSTDNTDSAGVTDSAASTDIIDSTDSSDVNCTNLMDYETPGLERIEFKGNIFVTAGLDKDINKEVKEYIEKHGGIIRSSVTKATNYLIYKDGQEETAQYKKALELVKEKGLGINILPLRLFPILLNTNIIEFGEYPFDADGTKRPIKWLVLERDDKKALLLSAYGLDTLPFYEFGDAKWRNSDLRKWLNGDFYNAAFSDEEKKRILLTGINHVDITQNTLLSLNILYSDEEQKQILVTGSTDSDKANGHIKGASFTEDKIFLLSFDEVNKYLAEDIERLAPLTPYANKQGAGKSIYGHCWWWLRSPGGIQVNPIFVQVNGRVTIVRLLHGFATAGKSAVRPALWISLESETE